MQRLLKRTVSTRSMFQIGGVIVQNFFNEKDKVQVQHSTVE